LYYLFCRLVNWYDGRENNLKGKMFTLKNIIFDLDGTITDTLPVIFDAFNHIVSPYSGRRHDDDEIYSYFGPPEEEILARFIPADEVQDGMDKLYQYYLDHGDRINIFDGLRKLLDMLLEKKIKTGLFTGKSRRGTEITLRQIGANGYFPYTITGNDVKNPKPDPEGVLELLKMMEAKPEQTLLIGDADADIRAGEASGVKTGLALWAGNKNNETGLQPDYSFNSVSDLLKFLNKALFKNN